MKIRHGQSIDDEEMSSLDMVEDTAEKRPDEIAEIAESNERVTEELATLPPHEKNAIICHCINGLTLAQTSQMIGRPQSTVYSDIKKGLHKLRKLRELERID